MNARPRRFDDAGALAARIIDDTNGDIVLGLPLGLGKAPHVANALYERARDDPSIRLSIFTALTLEPPKDGSDLERRFLGPVNERLFAGWPELAYAADLRADDLPPNIEITEFFLQAGAWLSAPGMQRRYASINYSHAAAILRERKVNVIAQLVAPDPAGRQDFSLSGNPDITLDVLDLTRARGGLCLMVGQTNPELPFMPGEAVLPGKAFDYVLSGAACDFPLFAPPNQPVSDADHAIGLRAAAAVPDGGTIQIGIGSIGDAFGAALIMRHRAPELFRRTLERLGGDPDSELRHDAPFERGLYGVSEMFAPAFLELHEAGILSRRAADGAVLHAGFFVGPRDFYRRLREATEAERARFQMKSISFVNTLAGDFETKARDRADARFVNNAMEVSLLGEASSDTLTDGRVVSGVGGQHDFAVQAFGLPGARSIIALPSTREAKGQTASRLVWTPGRATLPRHLRDLFITEYGLADLRGRSDQDCIAAMLTLADARFQPRLRREAEAAGKIVRVKGQRHAAENTPERIRGALEPARAEGWCDPYPFGSDFTEVERRLMPALARLKSISSDRFRLTAFALRAAFECVPNPDEADALRRLSLATPRGFREMLLGKMVLHAYRRHE